MKQKRYASWPLLLAPALLAFATAGEELSLRPQKGLVLTKTFAIEAEMSLEDSSTVIGGQERPMEMEINVSSKSTITVSDVYGALEDGRTTKLSRTYDTLTASSSNSVSMPMMGADMEMESSGSSELEGLEVVFSWNGDEYDTSFAEGSSGDEELLEGLEYDLDFGGLLPADEIEKDSTWTIEPQVFRPCFAPGGSLKFEMESEGDDMMGMGSQPQPSPDEIFGDFEGEVTAKLLDIEEADGVRLAVVRLELDLSTAKDLTEMMISMMEEMETPEGMDFEMEIEAYDSEFAFTGAGEFRWNLDAGVLHSLEITGDVTQSSDTSMVMGMGGQNIELEDSKTMGGSYSIKLDVGIEG